MNRCVLCSTELITSTVLCRECRLLLRNGDYFDPDLEVWLPVVGYEGSYEVSNLGRVRSLDRVITDKRGHPHPVNGRTLKLCPSGGEGRKYRSVGLSKAPVYVHRIVLDSFVGPCPEGMECCHDNDIGDDNRIQNLRWDTRDANILDKRRNGRNPEANKTHCPKKHPYDVENTRIRKKRDGTVWRDCRTCMRERKRSAKARAQAARAQAAGKETAA